ncbi:MAG: helix-turn-helix transcriptional regulator [Minisyncoccales bacterium]
MKENKIRPLILIFGMLTLFVFLISFASFYATENFSTACGCKLPPWVIIVSLSSLGLFVGSITYYLISNHFLKERKEIRKNVNQFLNLLEEEDKKVLDMIIKEKGKINQSDLTKKLNFDKVKISRIISKMEKKGILKKEKKGMTNKIILDNTFLNLFEN